jgi:arylsulfatase A-like enzyme
VKEVNLPENVGLWSQGQSPLQLYNLPGFFGIRYSREQWEGIWKVYQGLVSLLDDCVGMLVDALRKEGLYDDSMIIFTADHGEMLGSHCLWQKMCMYEEATHIPLSIKLPKGQTFVSQSDEFVSQIDILPTLCELLDVAPPPDLPGISLAETIQSGAPIGRDHVFIQYDGNGARGNFQRCIVNHQHKLIVDFFQNEVYFELYNLRDDPQEKFNLAFQEKDLMASLLDELINMMRETGDTLTVTQAEYKVFCDASVHYIQEPYYPLGVTRK